jgi:hypothetical protein
MADGSKTREMGISLFQMLEQPHVVGATSGIGKIESIDCVYLEI